MGSALSSLPSVDLKWKELPARETLLVVGASLASGILLVKVVKSFMGPKQPPQPPGFPFLGNLSVYAKRPKQQHLTFTELAEEYGDIYRLSVFGQPTIVVNSVDTIKECFIQNADVTSARPSGYLLELWTKGGKGIVWHVGTWKESRKFTLNALKDLGLGKSSIAEKISEEGEAMVREFSKKDGAVFDPCSALQEAAANVTFSLIFGTRFEYTDKTFRELVAVLNETMKLAEMLSVRQMLIELVPPLRIFPYPENMRKSMANVKKIEDFMKVEIQKHEETYCPGNNRDLIDLFIEKKKEGHKDHPVFCENNMLLTINDLMITGTDTTATALQWAFLYLINYPEVQKRIHQEIDEVVGSSRLPTLEDRPNMSYTHATCLEVLRHSCIATMSLPHVVSKDFFLSGYKIKKDAVILANIYAVHMSERYWDEPKAFRPERFIGEDGHILSKPGFLAFGVGPRQCLGESLARSEFFLFFTMILQKFTIMAEKDGEMPSLEGVSTIVNRPREIKMRAIPC